jgi:5-methyltetrahydropteroyltriglutamate--homocysteine methyltransferase
VDVGLLTTTLGWFPKPVELRRARWRFAEGEIDEGELRAVEERATAEVLRAQEEIGIDLPTDGQMDRGDMMASFAECVDGMEPGGLVRVFENRYYRRPRIVGDVGRRGPITVERWKAAARVASRPLKAIVTGPYTLMDWSFDEHYGSRERCCLALAEVVRGEVADLVAAGAGEIEIDEPAIGVRPGEMGLVAEALGRAVAGAGRAGKVRTWTQVCYGDLGPVIDAVLALPVDGILFEAANSGGAVLRLLERVPEDKVVGIGVIDVLSPEVEGQDVVRERAQRALERIPRERLWLCPDAGLRTLAPETARRKLATLVSAARSL